MTLGWRSVLVAVSLASTAWADLDEQGFEFYAPGDLQGQHDWSVQAVLSQTQGPYENASGRVVVQRDPVTTNQFLIWKAGFGGRQQARAVKRFAATTGTKVLVRFDFQPGSENVGGRLYFDQQKAASTALQFVHGTLHVLEAGKTEATDTGIKFQTEARNSIELRLDFGTHRLEGFLDGKFLGQYDLPPGMSALDQLNFFGGGTTFASALDNLIVQSVDAFPPTGRK